MEEIWYILVAILIAQNILNMGKFTLQSHQTAVCDAIHDMPSGLAIIEILNEYMPLTVKRFVPTMVISMLNKG